MNAIRTARNLMLALVASVTLALASNSVLADQIVMKDGKVVECEIVREESGFWVVKINGKEEIIDKADVKSVTRDSAKKEAAKETKTESKPSGSPAPDAAPALGGKKPEAKKRDKALTGTSRVAILNFGPPGNWQGKVESTVGIEISNKAWRDAMPMLEKDNVDVVVVRVNSGGGLALETPKFHETFNEYKRKWRTVCWVESAISAACMSPWVIEEWYFLPEGNAGGCTMFSGPLIMSTGWSLLDVLLLMEKASADGRHAKEIMRSMQITEPLSCNIDENNNVTWFQTAAGKYIVNPAGQILTFNARDAVKYGFAKGIAATPEELMKVMGINEFEIAGKEATRFIDDNMRKNDEANKTYEQTYVKYQIALRGARALQGEENRERRLIEVGVAKRHLNTLEKMVSINPNFPMMFDLPGNWFAAQREELKELAK